MRCPTLQRVVRPRAAAAILAVGVALLAAGCGSSGGGSFTLPTAGSGGGGGITLPSTSTTQPPPTSAPENGGGGGQAQESGESTDWAVVALFVIALAAVALLGWWIAKRRGAHGRYRTAVNDIYAEGLTLHDRLVTLGPQPGAAIAGVDTPLDQLSADVRRIEPDAPSDEARQALRDVTRDLFAVRSAVSAIETSGATAQAVGLPERLAELRVSLDRLLATR